MTVTTTFKQRFVEALTVLCDGPPNEEDVTNWLDTQKDSFALQEWAIAHSRFQWSQGIVVLDAAHVLASSPEEGVNHEMPEPPGPSDIVFLPCEAYEQVQIARERRFNKAMEDVRKSKEEDPDLFQLLETVFRGIRETSRSNGDVDITLNVSYEGLTSEKAGPSPDLRFKQITDILRDLGYGALLLRLDHSSEEELKNGAFKWWATIRVVVPKMDEPSVKSKQDTRPDTKKPVYQTFERGEEVSHPTWALTRLYVVDINYALRAVAVRLGEKKDSSIVVWPLESICKKV